MEMTSVAVEGGGGKADEAASGSYGVGAGYSMDYGAPSRNVTGHEYDAVYDRGVDLQEQRQEVSPPAAAPTTTNPFAKPQGQTTNPFARKKEL